MGRVARFSCSVFGSLLFIVTAFGQDELTPEEKAIVARGDRLQEIARLIQDPKNETEALATEAARLCGFVIWTEQREPVAQPLGTPRLGLALTKTELHAYSIMFRNGFRVKFGDVVAMFDYLLQKVGAKESCGPGMLKAMTLGNITDNPSQELLAAFLNGLAVEGSRAAEDQSRLFSFNENPTLDPIQLLILLRCGSEEMRAAAAKYQKKEPLWNLLVSTKPVFQQGLLPPQAEDGFTVVEQFGQGKLLEKAMETAIATQNLAQQQLLELIDMASKVAGVGMLLVKVSGVYMSLTGDVSCPDEPLVRTKDRFSGAKVTMRAQFKIDATSLSNYLKDNRFTFLLLGIDVDQPRSEKLKSIETEWKLGRGNSYDPEDIVEFTGQNPLRVLSHKDTGIATMDVQGKGRQQDISREPVLIPHMKKVWVGVTPQVKATDILQDLVDAAAVAASGPLGILTFISECLFRMKLIGQETHQLLIKDWWVVRNQASVFIRVQGSYTKTLPNGMMATGIDRGIGFTDVQMQDISLEPPPPFDWSTIPDSPTKRLAKQGYDASLEASKRLLFVSEKFGTVSSHVHDYQVSRGRAQECGGPYRYWNSTVTDGVNSEPYQTNIMFGGSPPGNGGFMVALREDQKKVWITADTTIKGTTISTGSDGHRTTTPYEGTLLDNVELDPQFSEARTFVVPLQNTFSQKEFKLWTGTVPITHKWLNGEASGTGIVSYSISRKLVNKK